MLGGHVSSVEERCVTVGTARPGCLRANYVWTLYSRSHIVQAILVPTQPGTPHSQGYCTYTSFYCNLPERE